MQTSIPLAFQLVVEDVGWWGKSHPVGPQEPFRTGMHRRHHPLDYLALVHLARQLNMRPLIAFVACEWDRDNLLKKVPTSTWMGADWDNRHNVGPWLEQAAQILSDHRDDLEIGLHGVGHEYWVHGRRSRTEFHDTQGIMRPWAHVDAHLDAFAHILEQNGLKQRPETFVPPGLNHCFGAGGEGVHCLLRKHGIRYVTTDMARARMVRPYQHPLLAWEEAVLIIERGSAPVPWHVVAAKPRFAFDRPVLSLHWANLLDENPQRNLEVVQRWVDFIKGNIDSTRQMLAPDTATCWTQLVYRCLSRIRRTGNQVAIDIQGVRSVPREALNTHFLVRIVGGGSTRWRILGGRIGSTQRRFPAIQVLSITPDDTADIIRLIPLGE